MPRRRRVKQGITASQLNRVSWANCCQHLQKACRPILGPCNFTIIGSLGSLHGSLELKILQPGSSMSHDSTKQLCNPRGLQHQVSNRKGITFLCLDSQGSWKSEQTWHFRKKYIHYSNSFGSRPTNVLLFPPFHLSLQPRCFYRRRPARETAEAEASGHHCLFNKNGTDDLSVISKPRGCSKDAIV